MRNFSFAALPTQSLTNTSVPFLRNVVCRPCFLKHISIELECFSDCGDFRCALFLLVFHMRQASDCCYAHQQRKLLRHSVLLPIMSIVTCVVDFRCSSDRASVAHGVCFSEKICGWKFSCDADVETSDRLNKILCTVLVLIK